MKVANGGYSLLSNRKAILRYTSERSHVTAIQTKKTNIAVQCTIKGKVTSKNIFINKHSRDM